MNVTEFIQIINDHRELLGKPQKGEDTGCPLRVALFVTLPPEQHNDPIFMDTPWNGSEPINPEPCEAAATLGITDAFAEGIASGWDGCKVYDDDFYFDEWGEAFSGFLIGASLRPAPLQLTSGI